MIYHSDLCMSTPDHIIRHNNESLEDNLIKIHSFCKKKANLFAKDVQVVSMANVAGRIQLIVKSSTCMSCVHMRPHASP